jgi:hypothetical protein
MFLPMHSNSERSRESPCKGSFLIGNPDKGCSQSALQNLLQSTPGTTQPKAGAGRHWKAPAQLQSLTLEPFQSQFSSSFPQYH